MKQNPNVNKTAASPVLPAAEAGNARPLFPVVGIGASAGGLEALGKFFEKTAPDSGAAFVIIQHLAPDHKGIMVELLQRTTAMPVAQVMDGMPVEPNRVYLIPPNKNLSIVQGRLHLFKPDVARGLRLPIDFFFQSLAEDRQEGSIGVILSGMGSDGTRGLRAIKEKAGLSLVQEPISAKFDGMPRSAIDAGVADIVAPVEELPGLIQDYLGRRRLESVAEKSDEPRNQSALEKIFAILRRKTGQDFTQYKRNTIYRRVERRISLHKIDGIAAYAQFLQDNPQEIELLFKELLIGVTHFFRDGAVWEHLVQEAIPDLLLHRSSNRQLRAWVPACSTGEEAYSLAIVFKEALNKLPPGTDCSLQIFATDLDRDAIDKARRGVYPMSIAADVSPERLQRFFFEEENAFRINKEIREMVIFAPQNVIMDPPFTKLDLLLCRNLLIYLSADLQKKLLPLFHYSLNPGGLLLLGSAESIGSFGNLFSEINSKSRLYRRRDVLTQTNLATFPSEFTPVGPAATPSPRQPLVPQDSIQTMVEQVLLKHLAPAALLTTDQGEIVYINGRTGKYLEPAAGKANLNVFAMAREGLRHELGIAFQKALRQQDPVLKKSLRVGSDEGQQYIDLMVQKLTSPAALNGMVIIVLADVAAPAGGKIAAGRGGKGRTPNSELEAELFSTRDALQICQDELQSTRNEMKSSQEELKSANEELQSANEELQSTNEELTTSKEEMQSMNEELQTINNELQAKVDQLSRAENDMNNLLNSTDIATLFLDSALRVRRFTTATTKLIKLIPGDIGRPITDIAAELVYPELAADTQEVLRALAFVAKEVSTSDGRWFSVKIMPYRTQDNKIDGVVITFSDITALKLLSTGKTVDMQQT